jgi:Icc protein
VGLYTRQGYGGVEEPISRGLKPAFPPGWNVRAEARTYLRNKSNNGECALNLNRRDMLLRTGAASLGAMLPSSLEALAPKPGSFSFIHFTDIHIEPILHADVGTIACFEKMNRFGVDFALCGGDLVFDSNETPRAKGIELYDLYLNTAKRLTMPVHSVPGNHDVFGLSNKSGILATDPLYGKKMFEDRVGKRYNSFDHKGWHFVLLDSIGITPDRNFFGFIDEEQLAWMAADLKAVGTTRPVIVMTHIPIASAVLQLVPDPWKTPSIYLVTNAQAVLKVLEPYNVKAVLQGHTHIRETVEYKGCQFMTSGAVCGNWWKGPRDGTPEGFAVITVAGDTVTSRYETYGFKAVT